MRCNLATFTDKINRNRNVSGQAPRLASKLPLNKGYPRLDDEFWNNLTLFASGMIAQAVDQRELHKQNIKFKPHGANNWSLPQQVRLPTLEIALSGIFPSMVFDNAEKDNPKTAGAAESGRLDSVVLSAAGSGVSTKQPWANDIVSVRFKGVQPAEAESTGPESAKSGGDKPELPFTCVSDAIIKVRRPAKFAMLKSHMVGRDVSWNARTGEFCLRMRSSIGQSMLESLKARVKAVDRFVSFFESMDKAEESIVAESVSLKEVTFSYGPLASEASNKDQPSRLWRITLNLSQNDIDLVMEETNPHLPVTDLMQKLVNGANGIGALMNWLPESLPALEAVKKIRETWKDVETRHLGHFRFTMDSVDEMSIQYSLAGTSPGNQPAHRDITFLAHIKHRRGEPWWHIMRKPLDGTSAPNDEFSKALKSVWEATGEKWIGLITGAAGRPHDGIASLLLAIDEAIRPMAGSSFQNNSEVVVLE
jgi:mediator of RNA polymerase II transcription subunit 14